MYKCNPDGLCTKRETYDKRRSRSDSCQDLYPWISENHRKIIVDDLVFMP